MPIALTTPEAAPSRAFGQLFLTKLNLLGKGPSDEDHDFRCLFSLLSVRDLCRFRTKHPE
jgi:hypothetical protein